MMKSVSTAALAVLFAAVVLPPSAAIGVAAAKPPPNPCKTFTVKSADKVLGISKHKHPAEKQTKTGTGTAAATRTCILAPGKKKLMVTTQRRFGGSGGPQKCYPRPKLGPDGQVCVSNLKSFHFSVAQFTRHGVIFYDWTNKTLPQKGKKMYAFALAQYKAYKG